jgi:hypothetical protein
MVVMILAFGIALFVIKKIAVADSILLLRWGERTSKLYQTMTSMFASPFRGSQHATASSIVHFHHKAGLLTQPFHLLCIAVTSEHDSP